MQKHESDIARLNRTNMEMVTENCNWNYIVVVSELFHNGGYI